MTALQKLYRILGCVALFLFLTAQSCDSLFFYLFRVDNPEPLDCSREVRLTGFSHNEDGIVAASWASVGEFYAFDVYYEGRIVASYEYDYPVDNAVFRIDWLNLRGASDQVTLVYSVSSFYTPEPCTITRILERPAGLEPVPTLVCANLRLTSPLGGMANGLQTFYWDALDGAVSYRVNIYDNADSPALVSVDAGSSLNTSIDVNQTTMGGETPLLVELVAADANGNTCTQRYEIAREAAAPVDPVLPEPTPSCIEEPAAPYC